MTLTIMTTDIERIVYGGSHLVFKENNELLEIPRAIVWELLAYVRHYENSGKKLVIHNKLKELAKKYNTGKIPRMSSINYTMRMMVSENHMHVDEFKTVVKYTTSKKSRATSGIFQCAVMLNGRSMNGCDFDCYYCPNQPGMPRSYVREGPSARRAEEWDQECVGQIDSRLTSYSINGHDPNKLEIIVLGGTWSSFPMDYRKKFINEVYYAVNTFYHQKNTRRKMLSLDEEKDINTNCPGITRIVGLTIETRPDCINQFEIESMLSFGVTRVQLGVQHTDNRILKKINRQCTIEDAKDGIKMLKDSGFKIICHYMPNLPGSSPDMDREMLTDVMEDPDLDCDDLKIYPTMVTTTSDRDTDEVYSVLEKWYRDGKYVPYPEEELREVLINFKCHPNLLSYRISRLFRDIPKHNTISGCESPHMREILQKEMHSRGLKCVCIRCREIKNNEFDESENEVRVIERECSEGREFFIELVNGEYILGFVRLRLPLGDSTMKYSAMPEHAFIRELHVYSQVNSTHDSKFDKTESHQHRGYGSILMKKAEEICLENSYYRVAVIAGVGVRGYYEKKHNYKLENNYMVKTLEKDKLQTLGAFGNAYRIGSAFYTLVSKFLV